MCGIAFFSGILPKEEGPEQSPSLSDINGSGLAYTETQMTGLSTAFGRALNDSGQPGAVLGLIDAASYVLPFEAAFCVVNRRHAAPIYLLDTFTDPSAKQAVQRYVAGTYLLNPAYNAFLAGLPPGLHRMRDLAPDHWGHVEEVEGFEVWPERDEEIGYRTHGWPPGCEELVLAMDLPGDIMGEISFSRSTSLGGFNDEAIAALRPFVPLISAVFRQIWTALQANLTPPAAPEIRLEAFGRDSLSPREAEVVHMVLKGHSSHSIGEHLGISLATVKTHRQNAYAKLGIATQQELFSAFLRSVRPTPV